MNTLIEEILIEENIVEFPTIQDETYPMYVLSNTAKIQGAVALLYPEVLDDFYQACGREFYIIPSSIHEVILVVDQYKKDLDTLNQMVCEVNETQVEAEEVLANHIYAYEPQSKSCYIPK